MIRDPVWGTLGLSTDPLQVSVLISYEYQIYILCISTRKTRWGYFQSKLLSRYPFLLFRYSPLLLCRMSRVQESQLIMSLGVGKHDLDIFALHLYCEPHWPLLQWSVANCRSPLHTSSINKDTSRQARQWNSYLWGQCFFKLNEMIKSIK